MVTIKYLKYILFITFLFFINISTVSANQSYDYTYSGVEEWGNEITGDNTAIINLIDKDGNIFNTYCIDHDTSVADEWTYSLINVENSGYIDKNTSDVIRNIVINAYPFIGIDDVRNISKIEDLTIKEAITATQAAIWHYANGYDFTLENNEKKLYDFYINIGKSGNSSTDIADIDIDYKSYFEEGKRNVLISIDDKNVYDLEYTFDKDLVLEYGVTLEKNDTGIVIKNVPLDIEFEIKISGKQKINKDVYFFMPNGGKDSSQSLVGVTSGVVNVSNSKKIIVKDNYYNINLSKNDSVTGKSIAGVTFKLSNTSDFSEYVFDKTTDENGMIIFDNIPSGTWYIKEINTPEGYIAKKDILEVEVENNDVNINVFNYPYGKIKIIKVNEFEERLDNVKFNLYKNEINEGNLIKENIVTDKNGEVIIEGLEPGKYILVETQTQNGYKLYSDEIDVNIEFGKTSEVKVVNETLKTGRLILRKIDSETGNFLKGATIGIYKDSEFKELFLEVITDNEELVIENIPVGKYYIKEIKAPDGYILNIDEFCVEIVENNLAELEILNHRIYKTGLNNNFIFIAGILFFIIFTTLFIGYNIWQKSI